MNKGAWQATVHRLQRAGHSLATNTHTYTHTHFGMNNYIDQNIKMLTM